MPFLLEHLRDKDREGELNREVIGALEAIGAVGTVPASLVIEGFDTGLSSYTQDREDLLVKIGPAVVPHVIAALEDPARSAIHRMSFLRVLGRLKNASANAVPAIVTLLDSEYPRVREAAAEALGQIAAQPDVALPGLTQRLTDPRPFVREKAAQSCGAFGAAAATVVPELIERLADEYIDVRVAAIVTLGRLGPLAKEAIGHLEPLESSENILVRDAARDALFEIRSTDGPKGSRTQ